MNKTDGQKILEKVQGLNNDVVNLEVVIKRKEDEIARAETELQMLRERFTATSGAYTLAYQLAKDFNLLEEEDEQALTDPEEVVEDTEE